MYILNLGNLYLFHHTFVVGDDKNRSKSLVVISRSVKTAVR